MTVPDRFLVAFCITWTAWWMVLVHDTWVTALGMTIGVIVGMCFGHFMAERRDRKRALQ